jgi:hypothetical protein
MADFAIAADPPLLDVHISASGGQQLKGWADDGAALVSTTRYRPAVVNVKMEVRVIHWFDERAPRPTPATARDASRLTVPARGNPSESIPSALASIVLSVLFVCAPAFPLATAAAQSTSGPVTYLNQAWSQADREWYYHFSQGSAAVSYDIFLNLEVADSQELFGRTPTASVTA